MEKKKNAYTSSAIFWVYLKYKIYWNNIKKKDTLAIVIDTVISLIFFLLIHVPPNF